jgi:uncharacterized protein
MLAYIYMPSDAQPSFEWDEQKNTANEAKHGVRFEEAQRAFLDENRIILEDIDHSTLEEARYYCIGKVKGRVCTVRFTYRDGKIRIFGAGFWRKEQKIYERNTKAR